jgi:phage-related protein
MAVETFSWCPKVASQVDTSFRTRKAQFGDGYAQVAGDGINPVTPQWSVSFTGDEAYIQAIKNFLNRHAGWKSFIWKPPLEPSGSGARNPSRYLPTATRNTPSVAHSYRHTIHEYFI